MDDLISRIVYHPAVAHSAIYLTETMARVDSSIGAAIIELAGALAIQLVRSLRPSTKK